MPFDPAWLIFKIAQIVPAIIALVAVVFIFFSFRIPVATADMDRAGVQMGELYLAYPELTLNRTVFSVEKLEKFVRDTRIALATDDEMPNVEPLRHCGYGSRIVIHDIARDKEWGFGYEPSTATVIAGAPQVNYEFDAAIAARDAAGRATVTPAKLSIHLYDTVLTRAACAAEQAALFKRATELRAPCILHQSITDAGSGATTTEARCIFIIEQTEYHLCMKRSPLDPDPLECRYLPKTYDIEPIVWGWKPDEPKRIVFYPLKRSAPQSACAGIETSELIASGGDPVVAVLGCLK